MVNRPKQKGTARETWLVKAASACGLAAKRFDFGAPGRDVDIHADVLRVYEVKDRANLNVHKTLGNTLKRWPTHPAGVVWHRTSRKGENVKATADGPTVVCVPVQDHLDLLVVARAARHLVAACDGYDLGSVSSCRDELRDAVDRITTRYSEIDNQEVPF